MIAARIVDVSQLLRVVVAALIAGIGVSIAFSLVIYGTVRAGERRQQERPVLAGAHVLLAGTGLVAVFAAIAYGVSVMLTK